LRDFSSASVHNLKIVVIVFGTKGRALLDLIHIVVIILIVLSILATRTLSTTTAAVTLLTGLSVGRVGVATVGSIPVIISVLPFIDRRKTKAGAVVVAARIAETINPLMSTVVTTQTVVLIRTLTAVRRTIVVVGVATTATVAVVALITASTLLLAQALSFAVVDKLLRLFLRLHVIDHIHEGIE